MSTATTSIPPPPARTSAAKPPQRVPIQAPAGGAGAPSGFGNIDPIRLLRRYWMLLLAAAVLGAVVGIAGHYALLKINPMYTASATFECRHRPSNTTSTSIENVQQADFDRFMGTQMNVMTSVDVLQDALKNSDLVATGWAKRFYVNGNFQPAKALPELQSKMSARLIAQTTLIRLSMTWKTPADVRTIVQAVANAYMQDIQNQERVTSASRREVLDRRRNEINEAVRTLTRTRDATLKDGRVTNLKEGADAAEQQQAKITGDLVEARQMQAQVTSLLKRLQDMAADNAVIPYPEDMQEQAKADPLIMDLNRQLTSLRVEEDSQTKQGLGRNHPTMQALAMRMQAAQAEQDSMTKTVLQRLYDARVEDLSKSVQTNDAREKKLISELDLVSVRKQELLRLLLSVEQIEEQTRQLNDELSIITRSKQELEALSGNAVFDRIRIVSPPQTPNQVSFPKLAMMIPLGVLLFAGLTATAVLLRELLDQRVKGPADVAMIPRLRVLGMVPDAAEDPSRPALVETAFRDTPGGVVTESFRQIRAPLVNKLDAEGLRTILILAGMPGSGATTVASNLAIACAGADEKVLVIDANFRRPSMHRVLGCEDALGMADCLAGQATLADCARPTSVANLSVLTAGSAGNRMLPERLSSEALGRLLAEAAASYDRVFIDSPPAIVSGDGLAIANRCDAVVMVVRALNEKRGLVNRIRTQLGNARAELLGVVVNGVKASAGGYFKRNIQATHDYHNVGHGHNAGPIAGQSADKT